MTSDRARLRETFVYFFRMGLVGFGGPLALVAAMQKDLIEKRRWMEPEAFARAFALIKAIPGPVAFQSSVFLGRHRAGWKGGVAAALALNAPAFMMMLLFGVFYSQWRGVGMSHDFLSGMQAAALGVILSSLRGLAKPYLKKRVFWVISAIAIVLTVARPALEPVYIVGFGLLLALHSNLQTKGRLPSWLRLQLAVAGSDGGGWFKYFLLNQEAGKVAASNIPLELFWSCFKSGAFVFGSGLAIVPLMEHDFVTRLGWLSHQEFMDALAFGQITPGPVVITATFIGYKSLGLAGAFIATGAIYLAPFIHMMTWFPRFVDRLARFTWISAFLTGAISAVVGAIVATVIRLGLTLDMKMISLPLLATALAVSVMGLLPVWAVIPLGGIISAVLMKVAM